MCASWKEEGKAWSQDTETDHCYPSEIMRRYCTVGLTGPRILSVYSVLLPESLYYFSTRPSAWTEKATKLRKVVKDILPIDVHCPQPVAPDDLPPAGADCLVSTFCLESVSPDLAAFTRALGHIGSLLRTGGHLLLIGALGESYYLGGPRLRIPVVSLNEAQVCASLMESGYTLIRLEVYTLPQDMRVGVDDVSGVFFVKARKL